MGKLWDGDTDTRDDEDSHDEQKDQVSGEQSNYCAEYSIACKDESPDENHLQTCFAEKESGISRYLLECPEIVELEEIHAFQKDNDSKDAGDHRPAIEEYSANRFGQDEKSGRGETSCYDRNCCY